MKQQYARSQDDMIAMIRFTSVADTEKLMNKGVKLLLTDFELPRVDIVAAGLCFELLIDIYCLIAGRCGIIRLRLLLCPSSPPQKMGESDIS